MCAHIFAEQQQFYACEKKKDWVVSGIDKRTTFLISLISQIFSEKQMNVLSAELRSAREEEIEERWFITRDVYRAMKKSNDSASDKN